MRTLSAMATAGMLAVSGCTGSSPDQVGTVADFEPFTFQGNLTANTGTLALFPTSNAVCSIWPGDGTVTADGVSFAVTAAGGGVTGEAPYTFFPNPLEQVTSCTEVSFATSPWTPSGASTTLRFKDSTKTLDLHLANLGAPRVATPAAPRLQDLVMVHCQVPETDASVVARFVADDGQGVSSFDSEAVRPSGGQANLRLVAPTGAYLPAPVSGHVFCVSTVAPDQCPFATCAMTVVGNGAPLTLDPPPEPDAGPSSDAGL